MIITYAEMPIEQLKFGVNRPEQWWAEHPRHVAAVMRMITNIYLHGMQNPLSVMNNGDGTCTVEVGNQRLAALEELAQLSPEFGIAPCVIGNKKGQKIIGDVITPREAREYFKSGISNMVLNENSMHITPADTDDWDGDIIFKEVI